MDKDFEEKRTIKVSGVSKLLKEQITRAFQSEYNSAGVSGDVARLYVCPDGEDHVLVEFGGDIKVKKPKSLKKVDIDGTELSVEPYVQPTASGTDNPIPVSSIWSGDDDKRQTRLLPERISPFLQAPFSETKVKLQDKYVEKIQGEKEARDALTKGKVKLEGGYLTGTWTAIHEAGQSLFRYLYGADQNENGDDHGESDPSVIHATPVKGGPGGEGVPHGVHTETVLVQTLLFRYIMTYHYQVFQALENVCEEIRTKIDSKNDKTLTLFPRLSKTVFDAAFNEFITFYQKQNEKMYQEIKSIRSPINMGVISEACSKFSVIIDVSEESKTKSSVKIYGEKSKVDDAVGHLSTKLGQLNDASSNPATTTTLARVPPAERFSCLLSNNVKLIVYQGDLTQEKVDAIVNPANERLEHFGGAAEAISKAGGRTIQSQSNDIMRKRRRDLSAGEVETTAAGRLSCKFIIHAVGPRRSEHDKGSATKCLYNAVMNSLTTASKNGAQSISIPAISSGVFGIPVDFCAWVLFDAVEAFAKGQPLVDKLQEIRFVNIDKPTTEEFMKEMMRRYSTNVRREIQVESSSPSTRNPWKKTTHNDAERQITAVTANPLMPNPAAIVNDQTKSTDPKAGSSGSDEKCSICLSDFTDKKALDKCGHSFCAGCIDQAFKHQKKCPVCSQVYGPLIGNQPPGKMTDSSQPMRLPGFASCGTIIIVYTFDGCIQGENHPNPGQRYTGTTRRAYLPDNTEGRKVLKLLRKAFNQKLTFTIGRSSTTGSNNVITWNDIHHKTNMKGGPTSFGYPDPDYLKRVQEELAAKGITE